MRIATILAAFFISTISQAATLPTSLKWETNVDAPTWSDPKATKGGTFTSYMLSFPPTTRLVGPNSNNGFAGYVRDNHMGLISLHPNTWEIIPSLATHWAYGEDGKTIYYKINPNARWSDGEPLTSDDFLYTLEFMRSKHINAPWYNNHYTEEIKNVTAYDDHTLSITGSTVRPNEELHYFYSINPTPRHFYGTLNENWVKDHDWKIAPNTGPYQISKIKQGKSIEFRRKKDWWAKDHRYNIGRFNVDKVRIKVIRDPNVAYSHFVKGELDSFGLTLPNFWHNKAKGKPYNNGLIHKATFYNETRRPSLGIFLNTSKKPLDDINVRLGLAHALNFDKVIKTVLRNDYERLNAFHTGYGEYSNEDLKARPYDLAQANKYLDQSGWTGRDGKGIRIKDGSRLSIELSYSQKAHEDRWAILAQDALKAGIEITLKRLDPTTSFKTIQQKQHQAAYMGWSTGFRPAYWQHFHSENADKPQTNNITNTAIPEMDKLIMSYRKETSSAKRIEQAQELASMIHEYGAFIPAFVVPYTRGAHWRWLKFPETPATKTSDSLYSVFGSGGLFWIDNKTKVDTMRARKGKSKFPIVNETFDQYRQTSS